MPLGVDVSVERMRESICRWYRENIVAIDSFLRAWYDGTIMLEDVAKLADDLSIIFPALRGLGDKIREGTELSKIILFVVYLALMVIHISCGD